VQVKGVSTEEVTVITENLDNKIDTGAASTAEILARVMINSSEVEAVAPTNAADVTISETTQNAITDAAESSDSYISPDDQIRCLPDNLCGGHGYCTANTDASSVQPFYC